MLSIFQILLPSKGLWQKRREFAQIWLPLQSQQKQRKIWDYSVE